MENISVKNQEAESRGSFYIEDNGQKIAEMTYSKAGTDRIIIDHTEVSDEYRGQKLGEKMVLKAVEHAREKKISIVPLCPFARAVFQRRHDEFEDVL